MTVLEEMGKRAKEASKLLAIEKEKKDIALLKIAEELLNEEDSILSANKIDLENAKKNGMSKSMLDRLSLSHERIVGIADGVRQIAGLCDPIGKVLDGNSLKNGLEITKVRVPLGVIGIIYEARPNVTADAAALCLKSGNAVILRGGKEAINSNKAITKIMRSAIESCKLPIDSIALIEDTSRQSSIDLMNLSEYLDVLIPRGGAGLINSVVQNAKVPVIETGVGNCHVYVDESSDFDMAVSIIDNAKTSRPSVCNAIETILIHKGIAKELLPKIQKKLAEKKVQLRCCSEALTILEKSELVVAATDEDYKTEFSDYILAVKLVDNLDEAIEHIAKYSTGHSEAIITKDYENARIFTSRVDSAAVYVNASTRFTDGGEFGLGAEIGISTQKLHARGPMGLNELTSMKFIIKGNGQIR